MPQDKQHKIYNIIKNLILDYPNLSFMMVIIKKIKLFVWPGGIFRYFDFLVSQDKDITGFRTSQPLGESVTEDTKAVGVSVEGEGRRGLG